MALAGMYYNTGQATMPVAAGGVAPYPQTNAVGAAATVAGAQAAINVSSVAGAPGEASMSALGILGLLALSFFLIHALEREL